MRGGAAILALAAMGFRSIYEGQPDEIRKRLWIIILSIGMSNETKTTYFNVVFDHQDAYYAVGVAVAALVGLPFYVIRRRIQSSAI